jgi:hypothetical protein
MVRHDHSRVKATSEGNLGAERVPMAATLDSVHAPIDRVRQRVLPLLPLRSRPLGAIAFVVFGCLVALGLAAVIVGAAIDGELEALLDDDLRVVLYAYRWSSAPSCWA